MNRHDRRADKAVKQKPSKAEARPLYNFSGKPGKGSVLKSGRGRLSVK